LLSAERWSSAATDAQASVAQLWTRFATFLSDLWAAFINWTSMLGDKVKKVFFSAGPKSA